MTKISSNIVGSINRFASKAGEITRAMNKIAINETKELKRFYTYPNATAEDLKRLTSDNIKDSYKRVTWTNPKDKKVYHILEEGRENGKVQVRILNQDGSFLKNAELTPKNIVIFDNFFGLRGMSHGEKMEVFIRRFNPFANVERLKHKKGLIENIKHFREIPMGLETKRFTELAEQMEKGKQVDYISISEIHPMNIGKYSSAPGDVQKKVAESSPYLVEIRPLFEKILSGGTRIFSAAGNDSSSAKSLINDRLGIQGVEGVGSIVSGKIAKDSCSRNSALTQHYERRNYFPHYTHDDGGKIIGVNITGLPGTDLPLNYKTKNMPNMGGTSYAVPVRVAKISLNDMMEGIL